MVVHKKTFHYVNTQFYSQGLAISSLPTPHDPVWGQIVGSTFWTDNLQYRVLNEQEVEVIGLKYRYGVYEIQIPSTVTAVDWNNKTYTITTIGDSAFSDCNGLTNINIPNSVTTIRNGAFQNSYLSNINIPNSVTTIGNGAFSGCDRLTNINIPNSVKTIGNGAFSSCYGLTNINIPNSVTTIGNGAFKKCGKLASIKISESVTTIRDSVFFECSGLRDINIPNAVKTIGNYAFYDCYGLRNISIPISVKTIGKLCFLELHLLDRHQHTQFSHDDWERCFPIMYL